MTISPNSPLFSTEVRQADFDINAEYRQLLSQAGDVGAIVTFVGLVREMAGEESVNELFLEHYAGMTEKLIGEILTEAATRWELLAARVIHRVGKLQPGDQIVYVGIASKHRADAFAACEFVMDYLKTRAAFWKKESDSSGSRWIESRDDDQKRAERWNKK
jgi:molybdopterin synthase catalytic subunit